MQRPPLQELPLDRFAPGSLRDISRTNKRPLSPGGPSLYSPAKRRILNDEGIFSLQKPMKAPMSPSKLASTSPAHFAEVLIGPASPARRLDFGMPKNHPIRSNREDAKQTIPPMPSSASHSRSNTLAPSPEFRPRLIPSHHSPVDRTMDVGDAPEADELSLEPLLSETDSSFPVVFTPLPRELPPLLNPRSEHFPGFFVHRDSYTTALLRDDRKQEEVVTDADQEQEKENTPLRRKIRKASSVPVASVPKSLLTSSMKGKEAAYIKRVLSTPFPSRNALGWGSEDDVIALEESIAANKGPFSPRTTQDDREKDIGM